MAINFPPNPKRSNAENDFAEGRKLSTKGTADKIVNMRFTPALLARIDAAADDMGISRTAWIAVAANEKLKAG